MQWLHPPFPSSTLGTASSASCLRNHGLPLAASTWGTQGRCRSGEKQVTLGGWLQPRGLCKHPHLGCGFLTTRGEGQVRSGEKGLRRAEGHREGTAV